MIGWKKILIDPSTTILQAMKVIDDSKLQIVLVVDKHKCLLGSVTDGDIRRAFLRGMTLSDPVEKVMNSNPVVAFRGESRTRILALMRRRHLHQIPLVDSDRKFIGLETMDELLLPGRRENKVVIMAGGLGSRLMPHTSDCPKPLLKVGGKPILESIIERLVQFGFYRIDLSVNYKAEMIEEYFGDGGKWNVEIGYIREEKKLGTAGSLSLMRIDSPQPLLVMNGDLVTDLNFDNLMNFHLEHQAMATMCVKEYYHQVPFGVVDLDNEKLIGITEKPMQQHFVNAGIYVLNTEVLEYVPRDKPMEMTELFQKLIDKKLETSVFPVWEQWLDVGRPGDLSNANDK